MAGGGSAGPSLQHGAGAASPEGMRRRGTLLSGRGQDGMREPGESGDAAPHLRRVWGAAAAPSRCRSGLMPVPAPRGERATAGIPAARTGAGKWHFHSLHSGRISGIPAGRRSIARSRNVCLRLSRCLRMNSRDSSLKWSKWVKADAWVAICDVRTGYVFQGSYSLLSVEEWYRTRY